jgi:hypothetical protein
MTAVGRILRLIASPINGRFGPKAGCKWVRGTRSLVSGCPEARSERTVQDTGVRHEQRCQNPGAPVRITLRKSPGNSVGDNASIR